ncbi:MAG: membrane dipeptidase [Chlamydiales bacterium]|nr:membrane dipeptidase [Chlamydiales bacterium]
MIPIVDLHCDLLSYLAEKEERHAENEEARCSLTQLRQGNVLLQTLAVYTGTGKGSVASAEKQMTIFRTLPTLYPQGFQRLKSLGMPKSNGDKVHIIAAIENASGLCSESENLENVFSRFDQYRESAGPILYISLTWNDENRFGGGNHSKIGLKRDGELLLEYLDGKKIAVDLSHTSDALAHDILNYIDARGLNIIPIASHSNFRSVAKQPRNLPDELAKEIFRREGLIGLNFVKAFVGKQFPADFARQVDYARSLGGFDYFCFGADFFYENDMSLALHPFMPFFYPPFGNASCYPKMISYLNEVFTKQELEKIAHINFHNFLDRINR